MSDHPPIPPNCKNFTINDFKGCDDFRITISQESFVRPFMICTVDDAPKYIRKVIACVARCAWLDEIERIEHKVCLDSRDSNGETGWDDASRKAYTEAEENAEAWRLWGEKK